MQFEYDPERLIEEVKKRPALWDFNHDDYRNKEVKRRLWGEIIQEMMQSSTEMSSDVQISKSQKRELELQLQKKWKSLRDCYQKYIQCPTRTKRPYLYYKQLAFLMSRSERQQQVMEQIRHGNENQEESSDSDEENKASRLWKQKRVYKLVKNEDNTDDDNDTSMMQHFQETTYLNNSEIEVHVPPKMRRVTNQLEEFAFANTDSRSDGEDTDKMFLLSLLPHLKAIPEALRLEAKMNMMKVLQNTK